MNIIKTTREALMAYLNKDYAALKAWEASGKPSPPPHAVKQQVIKALRDSSGYHTFVETGTYLGDMVDAQKNHFKTVYSIELGEQLHQDAVKKFKKYKNISILQGDSGSVLIDLCKQINEPAIFWLDGHYSEGITARGEKLCPIFEELSAIFAAGHFNHILLIDDARLFIGRDDYPTLDELQKFIKANRTQFDFFVDNDIIHVILK